MSYAKQMLDTHPQTFELDAQLLVEAIDALQDCVQACTACADACLGEDGVADLVRCIRLDLDCADVCAATAKVMTRQTAYAPPISRALVEAARTACATCAAECEQHAGHHEHCRVCAGACRRAEQACSRLLVAMGA